MTDLIEQIKTIAIAGAAPYIQRGLEQKIERMNVLMAEATAVISEQHKRIAKMEAALEQALEFIDGYVDVVDGSYGEPAPNAAMQVASEIKEALAKAQPQTAEGEG